MLRMLFSWFGVEGVGFRVGDIPPRSPRSASSESGRCRLRTPPPQHRRTPRRWRSCFGVWGLGCKEVRVQG